MKTTKIFQISSVVMLTGIVGLFTHCSAERAPGVQTASIKKDKGQIIQAMNVATGIKDYEQINMTMSVLTGVDPNSVSGAFNQASSSLPTENDSKQFSSSNQVAITKMAAEYCNSLIGNNTLRTAFYPDYNFNMKPKEGLTQENRDFIIEQTLTKFWGEVATDDEKAQAHEELNVLIDELLENENMDSTATNQNVIKGVCTVVLSTPQVTLL